MKLAALAALAPLLALALAAPADPAADAAAPRGGTALLPRDADPALTPRDPAPEPAHPPAARGCLYPSKCGTTWSPTACGAYCAGGGYRYAAYSVAGCGRGANRCCCK